MRATVAMIAGKEVIICGYGDAGRSCALTIKASGSRVAVCKNDINWAIKAKMEGIIDINTLDSFLATADIFITDTCNKDSISAHQVKKIASYIAYIWNR